MVEKIGVRSGLRILLSAGVVVAAGILVSMGTIQAGDAEDERLFPLDEGRTWIYHNERFGFTTDTEVVDRRGNVATYRIHSQLFTLIDEGGDFVDIELGDGKIAPFYRFPDEIWIHRDLNSCDDSRQIVVVNRDTVIRTPAGEFHGVFELNYSAPNCFDAGRIREWWAPGVGLIKWEELNIAGLLTHELMEFSGPKPSTPEFLRGDANDSGNLNITDAIFVLDWLFVGGEEPPCLDAADGDDSGQVNISDPILFLQFLFMGGVRPAPPGPATCGVDPSEDRLELCVSASC